ncbi:hypothetical protein [Bradyrhizobium jicamae]|uniref:hypothetical protein n=1 Tax=Bradyrhizobium jicamae TaxID=280332 RepID=UPI000B269B21|nr:hypothetical protein [Bradyrhizobium jicamae]
MTRRRDLRHADDVRETTTFGQAKKARAAEQAWREASGLTKHLKPRKRRQRKTRRDR